MTSPQRRRRLAFGQVAELYDSARPSYPAAVFDELFELGAFDRERRVLEVGAGTGRATLMLAARGTHVLALEPDPAMAAVARRNCAEQPLIEIEQRDFASRCCKRTRTTYCWSAGNDACCTPRSQT